MVSPTTDITLAFGTLYAAAALLIYREEDERGNTPDDDYQLLQDTLEAMAPLFKAICPEANPAGSAEATVDLVVAKQRLGFAARVQAARLREQLSSRSFYELMQAYRHATPLDQPLVTASFEAVKRFILQSVEGQR